MMKQITQRQFRILLVLSVLTGIAGLAASIAGQACLPKPLRDYLQAECNAELKAGELLIAGLVMPLFLGFVASVIGLYRFRPWSRPLTLVVWTMGIALTLFAGPAVETALATTLYELSMVLSGMVLALIYFSPVAERFQPKLPGG